MPLRQRLRQALPAATKARDRVSVSALRSTLGAIDNAEAVATTPATERGLAIEESPNGVGAADTARLSLTEEQIEQVVRTEVAERESAAGEFDRLGRPERAEQLRAEAGVLSAYLVERA